jgi:pimeloyl-ACP methyl ester carboxylesterase
MTADLDRWRALGRMQPWREFEIFMVDSAWHDATATSKPTLLLIHGYPTSSWDFSLIWPTLCSTFRVVTADLLGMGFGSKPWPHRYRIAEQADLMEAVIHLANIDHCHVLAHDYGDTVAQELLARDQTQPQSRYLSVTLLNGGLFPETHRARLMQKMMASPLGPLLARFTTRKKLLATFCSVFGKDTQPDSATLDSVWELTRINQGIRVLPPLLSYIAERKLYRTRWLGALQKARMPLALINGSSDPVSGAHMVARFRELVGTHHFIRELPRIGHYPQIEAPEAVLDGFKEFTESYGVSWKA